MDQGCKIVIILTSATFASASFKDGGQQDKCHYILLSSGKYHIGHP